MFLHNITNSVKVRGDYLLRMIMLVMWFGKKMLAIWQEEDKERGFTRLFEVFKIGPLQPR